jgi:hypothetical protein
LTGFHDLSQRYCGQSSRKPLQRHWKKYGETTKFDKRFGGRPIFF